MAKTMKFPIAKWFILGQPIILDYDLCLVLVQRCLKTSIRYASFNVQISLPSSDYGIFKQRLYYNHDNQLASCIVICLFQFLCGF